MSGDPTLYMGAMRSMTIDAITAMRNLVSMRI